MIPLVFGVLFFVNVASSCIEHVVEGPESHIYTSFFKLNKIQNNYPDNLECARNTIGWNAPEIYRIRLLVYGTNDAKLWINRYADEEEVELGL